MDTIIDKYLGKMFEEQVIVDRFASSFTDGVNDIYYVFGLTLSDFKSASLSNDFFLLPATDSDILKILRRFDINKSPGYDGIRPKDIIESWEL